MDERAPRKRVRLLRIGGRVAAWGLAFLMMLTLVARAAAHTGWGLDMVATVAAQIASASLLVGVVCASLRLWGAGVVLVGVALLHWVWLSAGRADRVNPETDGLVSVMTFNAYALNDRTDLVIDVIDDSDADIVVVVEARAELQDAIAASVELMGRYPGRVLAEPRKDWNVAVLSRWPLRELSLRERHEDQWKRWRFNFVFRRSAVIERPAGAFLVTALWPDSPKSAARWREGNHETREFGAIMRECLQPLGYPQVVCTDLNATPSGYRTELVRHATGLRRSKPLMAMGGTWPSSLPPILRVAIDDVLVSDGIRVASWRTLERETGSDHVPVIAELLIPSAPAAGPGEGGVP